MGAHPAEALSEDPRTIDTEEGDHLNMTFLGTVNKVLT